MHELLDLTELEPRWTELKSAIGCQMFHLAGIRQSFRALHKEHKTALSISNEVERSSTLSQLAVKREQLTTRRSELRATHNSDLETYRVMLKHFNKMGKDMTSKARRSQNGTAV